MASMLVNQAYAVIETCRTAIASPIKQTNPSGATLQLARSIVEQARQSKSDPILKTIEISDMAAWPDILAAMQILVRTLE